MSLSFALYTTAALMAFVAFVCTALLLAWTIPSWRQLLSKSDVQRKNTDALTGLTAQVGSVLIAIGIAGCAGVAWFGLYSILSNIVSRF